jgi:L-fucose isomerase-like protein
MPKTKKMTFGLIVGNRGFFPDALAKSGREDMIRVLKAAGHKVIIPGAEETKVGAISNRQEAQLCAKLFRKHRDEIDGIILTLPNFGEETAIVETIKAAALNVPVLIQATPDEAGKMTIAHRRDSFCGKMSACSDLRQIDVPYTLTKSHTVAPDTDEFKADLERFAAVCRVVNGLRKLRIGAIGARPAAFNTVRYSEKLLALSGIDVEPIDLSEILGRIERMKDNDDAAQAKLADIKAYVSTQSVPAPSLLKMAKLGAVIDGWMKETMCTVSAIQCWTSLEEYFGVVPCTVMSMMSNNLLPSACEVDVCGVVGMQAMALATGTPSALLDWNNNYGSDPNKAVCFHCSNLPKHFFNESKMDYQEIIAGTVGKLNTFGTIVGKVKASPMTYFRVSTDDIIGEVRGYIGEGRFTDDSLNTFGGAGVVEIPEMQRLLHFICENGFEHHVAASLSNCADAVEEATSKYLRWEIYRHS